MSENDSVQLDDDLFFAAHGNGDETSMAAFTRRLRALLRDGAVVPLPGLELSASLEAFMKLARFRIEFAEPRLELLRHHAGGVDDAEGSIDDAATELCEEAMSLAIWLRNLQVPSWMYRVIDAPTLFRTSAEYRLRVGDDRAAMHWSVALLVVGSTILASDGERSALERRDLERVVMLERSVGARALAEELEAWHDLLSSYRLFR